MQKVKKDIADRAFEPVYLLYGPEAYFRRSLKNALRAAITGEDEMNYTYREGRDAVFTEVRDLAETLPFFADRRLIVLENTGWFKKGGDALAEYLPELPETTVLVLVEEEIDKRSKLFKTVGKCGYAAECRKLSDAELEKFILQGFKKNGTRITGDALELFTERCGDDLDMILCEEEKLTAYCLQKDGIRREDVEKITSVTAQNRVFDMLDLIAAGKPQPALGLFADLMALKEPPMRILYLMTQHVNRLLQIKELSGQKYSFDSIAEATGLRSFAVRKYAAQAKAFTEEKLRSRLEKLTDYEAAVKSGNMDDRSAVELALAELSGNYD